MIWAYRPYRNPVAKKRYMRTIAVLYAVSLALIAYRFLQYGFGPEFYVPSLALLVTVTFFSALILRKPRYCYTDVQHIYCGGKKIRKDEVTYQPDFENLTVDLDGKVRKTLYFEKPEDLERFLRDVGYSKG
ncbi:hypothetical protein [Geoglobus sp.]